MSDYIALTAVRLASSEALSARPDAPVVDDGYVERPARQVRRSLAATLRTVASVERRWADRLDPVCG
jgi:hypothetical protein